MKKYSISILATVIAVLITAYFFVILKGWSGSAEINYDYDSEVTTIPTEDTAFGDLFERHYVNDSLPYYIFRRMQDSIDRIKFEKNKGYVASGDGIFIGTVGFEKNLKNDKIGFRPEENDPVMKKMKDTMDNLSSYFPGTSKEEVDKGLNYQRELVVRYNERRNELKEQYKATAEKDYWLSLKGYKTAENTKFFIHNNKYYLAVVQWDSVKNRGDNTSKYGHYVRKEISILYSAEDQKVKIPISKEKYNLLKGFLNVIIFVILFVIVYVYIGLPIQLLLNISRGRPFSRQNNRAFKIMTVTLITLALLYITEPYFMHLLYKRLIPAELWLEPLWPRIYSKLYLFLIAGVIFIIGKAFKRGYRLQQEEDLTV